MNKTRLEAFSDGVFAIIITIMVLELKVPEGDGLDVLTHLLPVFGSYVLSFVYVGIYWGNHHHLMHTARKVSAGIMWANMHLLFWLSLVPFATGWMGENKFGRVPVAMYGALLLACGLAYTILSNAIKKTYKNETPLTEAIAKSNVKGYVSVVVYGLSVPLALYINPALGALCFVIVAIMWIIPSRHIERAIEKEE